MARADAKARRNFLSLNAAAQQYGQLRRGYGRVFDGSAVQFDTQHAYAELRRGLPALVDGWSVWTPGKPNGRPWDGMSDRERLVWMVKVQADPWWPSAAERDARWEEMHGAERERMQNHRQRVSRSSRSRVDAG
jgi:hypothetical protein